MQQQNENKSVKEIKSNFASSSQYQEASERLRAYQKNLFEAASETYRKLHEENEEEEEEVAEEKLEEVEKIGSQLGK